MQSTQQGSVQAEDKTFKKLQIQLAEGGLSEREFQTQTEFWTKKRTFLHSCLYKRP